MLTRALEERGRSRHTLMRATIHTVSAADYWPMMAGIRRINREWYAQSAGPRCRDRHGRGRPGGPRGARRGPLSMAELTRRIEARGFPTRRGRPGSGSSWCGCRRRAPGSIGAPISTDLPTSGCRGSTWRRSRGSSTSFAATSEHSDPPHFGHRRWMGVNVGQMRRGRTDGAAPVPRRGRQAAGRPSGRALPDPETPAPVRFLAVWDATLLVHARRTEILPEALRPRIFNTEDAALVQHLPGRRAGRRHVAPRERRDPDHRAPRRWPPRSAERSTRKRTGSPPSTAA